MPEGDRACRRVAASFLLVAALASRWGPAIAGDSLAIVLGDALRAEVLADAANETDRVSRLRDWIWARVRAHFIERERLAATPAEIAELAAYDREFERRDRAQRERKLAELEQRLAEPALSSETRDWLEAFRRVLVRMAERDAEASRGPPADPPPSVNYSGWIEFWKSNRVLYERYGGTVVATGAGPVPSGAWQALIEEYERAGAVRVLDDRLRRELHELLARPPAPVLPPDQVDFTPFWKRPIPPSYYPE